MRTRPIVTVTDGLWRFTGDYPWARDPVEVLIGARTTWPTSDRPRIRLSDLKAEAAIPLQMAIGAGRTPEPARARRFHQAHDIDEDERPGRLGALAMASDTRGGGSWAAEAEVFVTYQPFSTKRWSIGNPRGLSIVEQVTAVAKHQVAVRGAAEVFNEAAAALAGEQTCHTWLAAQQPWLELAMLDNAREKIDKSRALLEQIRGGTGRGLDPLRTRRAHQVIEFNEALRDRLLERLT